MSGFLLGVPGKLKAIKAAVDAGPVKSVQRGTAASAGTITITAVDLNRSIVLSNSKGSTGTVAATGDITGTLTGTYKYRVDGAIQGDPSTDTLSLTGTRSLSGGTTDLTVGVYSARLTAANELTVDGPCEWQVIEYR